MGVDDLGTWRTADEMKLEESIEEKPIFPVGFLFVPSLLFYFLLWICE